MLLTGWRAFAVLSTLAVATWYLSDRVDGWVVGAASVVLFAAAMIANYLLLDEMQDKEHEHHAAGASVPPGIPADRPASVATPAACPALGPPVAELARRPHASDVIVASGDGRWLATTGDGPTVALWDVAERLPRRAGELTHTAPVAALAFGAGGRYLAGAGRDGTAAVWDLAEVGRTTPVMTVTHHQQGRRREVHAVSLTPDGRVLATGGQDGTVIVWALHPRGITRPVFRSRHRRDRFRTVEALLFDPTGRFLAVGGQRDRADAAELLDIGQRPQPGRLATLRPQLAATATASTPIVCALAFRPHGRMLVTASTYDYSVSPAPYAVSPTYHDSAVVIWDLTRPARPGAVAVLSERGGHTPTGWRGRPRRVAPTALTGHTAPVRALAFHPAGRFLATGGDDTDVLIWDLTAPRRPRIAGRFPHDDAITALVTCRGGRALATGCANGTLRLWNLDTG